MKRTISQATTLLCTGDIHIGRRPSRLPTHLDGRRFAASAAWNQVVDEAVQRRVDAVVLTGDIVERENRYYEALGPLEQGLRRLGEESIQTFAVAGNHDFDVFPEIVESLKLDGFHLLGPRGTWTREALIIENELEPRLFLDGWSFPQLHMARSPLETYKYEQANVPVLGVLHGEVDPSSGTRYAPVSSSELARAGPVMWLMGHRHSPTLKETETGVKYLYPGSPQPLGPNETGAHGPWLIHVHPTGAVEPEQLITATVRYEEIDVDLTDVDDEGETRTRVVERIRQALHTDLDDLGPVERLVCRLKLRGRTSLHGSVLDITSAATDDFELNLDDTTATIDTIRNETRPAIDLDALATARSPSGSLARIVRDLEAGKDTPEIRTLLAAARERVTEVDRSRTYAPISDRFTDVPRVGRADLRSLVRQQALLLIDELEGQKHKERP
ncbi:MAG: DNA repair exonuclease [Gemmatimonadota bacterium]